MKWFCLDSIRWVERLLTGNNRMIVIYDPHGTVQHHDLLNNIYICDDLQQLSSMYDTACLLILVAVPHETFSLHEDTCIISLTKLKKSIFSEYHHYRWHHTTADNGSCTFKWNKQKPTAGILNKWVSIFDHSSNEYDVHIYYKQPLYINRQLEDVCFDSYSVYINAYNIDIDLELQGNKFAYVKFAWNYREQIALYEEIEAIRKCSSLLLSYFVHPEVMKHTQQMLILTDPKPRGISQKDTDFGYIHLEALKEIYYQTRSSVVFESSYMFREISNSIGHIESQKVGREECGIIAEMQHQLVALLMHMDEKMTIETALAHNNFTAQHTFIRQERLFVHEWSCVKNDYPMLYDVFQHIFYTQAVSANKDYMQIKQTLEDLRNTAWMQDFLKDNDLDLALYLRLYLLFQISEGLKRYTQRPHINPIPKQLIQVWHEALTDVLTQDVSYNNLFC